jgi:hypothetical protein
MTRIIFLVGALVLLLCVVGIVLTGNWISAAVLLLAAVIVLWPRRTV